MTKVREKVCNMYNRLSKTSERQQGKYSDKSKQGSILMLVLGVFTLLIILFVSLSSLSLRTYKNTQIDIERQQANLYAKTVLQAVIERFQTEPDLVEELINTDLSTTAVVYTDENEIYVDLYFEGNSIANTVNITAYSSYQSISTSISAVISYETHDDGTYALSYRFVD